MCSNAELLPWTTCRFFLLDCSRENLPERERARESDALHKTIDLEDREKVGLTLRNKMTVLHEGINNINNH